MAITAPLPGSERPPWSTLPDHVSPLLRARVAMHRFRLTRAIADGSDHAASPELALRALQLTQPGRRRDCIRGLEHILREATAPSRPWLTSQVPIQRAAVRAARPFLLNLLERLRETEHPRPAGIARTLVLLTDGHGPVWSPAEPGALAAGALLAANAL